MSLIYHTVFQAAVALITSFLLFKTTLNKLKSRVPVHGVPMAPDSHCLLGHWRILLLDFKTTWKKLSYDYANKDGLCSFWVGTQPGVTVNVPMTARKILGSSSLKPNLPHATKFINKIAGEHNLLTLHGDMWKANRKAFTLALSGKGLKKMYQPIRSVALALSKTITKNTSIQDTDATEVDMVDILRMVTIDIVGKTFFGVDFNCCDTLKQTSVTKALDFLMDDFTVRFNSPLNPKSRFYSFPCERNQRFRQALQITRTLIKECIEKRKAAIDSNDKETDLISLLYQALRSSGESNNIEEAVLDMVMTTYIASYDATTITLVYIFYSIATNPFIEELCLEEINRALRENPEELNPDDLPYCSAVVTEAVRLYPVFPVAFRGLEKSYKVGDITLPRGMSIFVPIWEIQRDARNYPRPNDFVPERWVKRSNGQCSKWTTRKPGDESATNGIAAGSNDAFLAFSAGGRNCVGQKLARAETCIIFAEILRHLKFEVKPGYQMNPVRSGVIQKPEGGMPMTVMKRI